MGGFENQIEAAKLCTELDTSFKGTGYLLDKPSIRRFRGELWKIALHIEQGEEALNDTVKRLGEFGVHVLIYNPTLVDESQMLAVVEHQAA